MEEIAGWFIGLMILAMIWDNTRSEPKVNKESPLGRRFVQKK